MRIVCVTERATPTGEYLNTGMVHAGDAKKLIWEVQPDSVALSVWSPPYHVGKEYEAGQEFEDWQHLLAEVIAGHAKALVPGGFCVVNIADILCFEDQTMPRIMAETISDRRLKTTKQDVMDAMEVLGTTSRYVVAQYLGVSEQTVDRRLNGNNIRGGKYAPQTRVKTVAGMIEDMAMDAGLYLYDRRVWVKDPAWANSRWHTSSLRAIDEFEYLFVLWRPGVTRVDRNRLSAKEWREWGSRGVWKFPSVRTNFNHEAMFPIELPRRVIKLLSDPGDVVLDPFAGSGTSLAAAIELGRVPLGFELSPKYVELARRSMNEAKSRGNQTALPLS